MTDAVATLLATDPGNPATLSDDALLDWLQELFCVALGDEAFRLRLQMRAIWQAHPELLIARERLAKADRTRQAAPEHGAWIETSRALKGASLAEAGLSEAVARGQTDQAKLDEVKQRVRTLRAEADQLQASSPAHRDWALARETFEDLLIETGLFELREELSEVERTRGHKSGTAGRRFEDRGAATVEAHLLPRLRARGHDPRLLRGVTLGCARGEWDGLVVEAAATNPVVVLAMVEFKRNPNDLARGFTLRQENLAWLTGDATRYDPTSYRTARYPTGHFAGPVTEAGLTFTRRSFATLGRDARSGDVLEGLHFVTRERRLTGLGSKERSRLLHRIATDRSADWTSRSTLAATLRDWLDPDLLRTADVLKRYADAGLRANVQLAIPYSG